MNRVYRVRPYDYRRDGAIGNASGTPNFGGIFGQRNCPANHTGIFEAQWALPAYVEDAELRGGPLFSDTLKADVTMSDPIERNIRVPDLGPDADGWRMPWPRQAKRPVKKVMRRAPVQLGADPVPVAAPAPVVERPGLVKPLLIVGAGVLLAKLIFGK